MCLKQIKKLLMSLVSWQRTIIVNLNSVLYRVFDRDNNGYITRDELQRAMQMIGENVTDSQLNDMLALADLDKDGRINYEGNYPISQSQFVVTRLIMCRLLNNFFLLFFFQNLQGYCCKV